MDALADLHDLATFFLSSTRNTEEDPNEGRHRGTAYIPDGPLPEDAAGLANPERRQVLQPALEAQVELVMASV